MFCPKCGTENKDTPRFCKNCGQPLPRKARPARAPKKMPWLIGILALVMVCVVAVVVIYPRLKGKLSLYAGVYGTYINQDNPDEYLELKEDGTFYLKEMGVGFAGEWEIEEDVLTLSFPQVGLEVKSKLKGDTIIDEEGKIWVSKEGKRIMPITPALSPGAIVPRVLTITNPETSLSGVRVYDSRDAPHREGHIFLVSGREAVVIEAPAVSKSAGIDVASLFKLENERIRKVAYGQLSTSDEDGYIVWINPHLCFEIAIEDWEGEVALAEVALTRDQDTIKSRFTFRAQEERGGLLSGEITALVDGVIVGHSRLPGIEVRPSREPEVIVTGAPTVMPTPIPSPDKAAEEFKAVPGLDANDADAHSNLGVVYYQKGLLNEAVSEFQAALDINPDDAEVHYLLGAAYVQMGRMDEAMKEFNTALEYNPDLPEAYFGLGTVHKLQGNKEEAIRAFERFLELGPGQDPQAQIEAERLLRELKGQ